VEYATGPLRLPAVLHDLKPLVRVLAHFESNLVRLFEAAPPVVQPLCVIAGIDLGGCVQQECRLSRS
jgi:hypothetical protein